MAKRYVDSKVASVWSILLAISSIESDGMDVEAVAAVHSALANLGSLAEEDCRGFARNVQSLYYPCYASTRAAEQLTRFYQHNLHAPDMNWKELEDEPRTSEVKELFASIKEFSGALVALFDLPEA